MGINSVKNDEYIIGLLTIERDGKDIPCKISIYKTDVKRIPHFHIKSIYSKNFHCCICICDNKYYKKRGCNDKLSDKEALYVYDILKQRSSFVHVKNNKSNWSVIRNIWSNFDTSKDLITKKCIPNYSKINEFAPVSESSV